MPTITSNDDFSLHAEGTRQVRQLPRQRGEAETPTSNQLPRVNRGHRLLGLAVCLLGRSRPCLGGGVPGPSWRAFPFSAAENLFAGAMGVATGTGAREKKRAEQEKMGDGGQPAMPTITGNDGFSLHVAGTRQVGQLSRQRGEAETPTSNQSPRVDQGHMLLGPAALRTFPLALPRSQVRARLGPRGYCRRSGNGGPQT